MTETTQALDVAQTALRIGVVELRTADISSSLDIVDYTDLELVQQSYRKCIRIREAKYDASDSEEIADENLFEYGFFYDVGIRLVKKEDIDSEDVEAVLEIKALFEASYLAHEEVPQDSIEAFSENNVGYHVWPFWREFVQSTAARMGKSGVLEVPMYRITRSKPKD